MENQEVLNEIYLAVRCATYGIDNVKNEVEPNLKELILKQNKLYEQITKDCQNFAKKNNLELKDINMFMKAGNFMQAKMETMCENANANVAEMMFNGTNMGILNISKLINNGIEDNTLLEISKKLLCNMEEFVNSIKQFLK